MCISFPNNNLMYVLIGIPYRQIYIVSSKHSRSELYFWEVIASIYFK